MGYSSYRRTLIGDNPKPKKQLKVPSKKVKVNDDKFEKDNVKEVKISKSDDKYAKPEKFGPMDENDADEFEFDTTEVGFVNESADYEQYGCSAYDDPAMMNLNAIMEDQNITVIKREAEE